MARGTCDEQSLAQLKDSCLVILWHGVTFRRGAFVSSTPTFLMFWGLAPKETDLTVPLVTKPV